MSKPTVLLIDHNEEEIRWIAESLNNADVTLLIQKNGRDGLACMQGMADDGKVPCLVLVELTLPDMHGLDVLKSIRLDNRTRFVPVITLARLASEEEIRQSYLCGANCFVAKPIEEKAFMNTVNLMCVYWTAIGVRLPAPEA